MQTRAKQIRPNVSGVFLSAAWCTWLYESGPVIQKAVLLSCRCRIRRMTAAKSRATSTALGQTRTGSVHSRQPGQIQAILSLEAGTLTCNAPQRCDYSAGFQIGRGVSWLSGERFSPGRLINARTDDGRVFLAQAVQNKTPTRSGRLRSFTWREKAENSEETCRHRNFARTSGGWWSLKQAQLSILD